MDEEAYKKDIWRLSTDAWKLFKDHINVRPDDAYWDEIIDKFANLTRKYKETKLYDFAGAISIAYLDELQREHRRKEAK